MALTEVIVVGTNRDLVAAWSEEFGGYPAVRVVHGSIFDADANTLVSPANSFGVMDGGLDGKLRDYFGPSIEQTVRERIRRDFDGELPVGLATVVETGHPRHRYLVSAPTMRCPTDVSLTINAYLAMRATLNAASRHPEPLSVAIPGFCALTGGMPPTQVARQMRIAYERVVVGLHSYRHWREEREFERYIRGDSLVPPAEPGSASR
ncbi:MAG: macro domain-containing protein [Steroidobacteraceae bacterium]